jgi:hypothetical protein
MVDSKRDVFRLEMFWSKFSTVDAWKALVVCALMFCPRLIILYTLAGAGKSVLSYVSRCYFRVFFGEAYGVPLSRYSIIEDIRTMFTTGLALFGFFYFDFRDDRKKGLRGLLSSLLVQLCHQSDAYYGILSDFYLAHLKGELQASDRGLAQCLKQLLQFPEQPTIYIIIDALDESPTMTGLPTPREEVLDLVRDLVTLQIPNLRICVTSRPEADIEPVLGPLAFRSVSVHAERGQVQDIEEYIKFVVNTDRKMRTWRKVDKELVIEVLTSKADGM